MDFSLKMFTAIAEQMEKQNGIYAKIHAAYGMDTYVPPFFLVVGNDQSVLFCNHSWMDYGLQPDNNVVLNTFSEDQKIWDQITAFPQCVKDTFMSKKKMRFISNPLSTRIGMRYLEMSLLPIFDFDSSLTDDVVVQYVLVHAQDVTEDVMLKKELESVQLAKMKQEAFYKRVFNYTKIVFALHKLIFDAKERVIDFEYVEINPAYEHTTGRLAKELVGKTLLTIFPDRASHSADWISLFSNVEKNKSSITIEHGYQGSDQCYRTSISSPGKGYIVTFSENVTEYKKMEQQLIASVNKWQTALASMEQGVWQWRIKKENLASAHNGVLPLSEGYCSLWYGAVLGLDISNGVEWLNSWKGALHPDDHLRMKEYCRRILIEAPESFVEEHRILNKQGSTKWLRVKGKKVNNSNSLYLEYIGVHNDITELNLQKETEKSLQTQQFQQSQILNEIADGNNGVSQRAVAALFEKYDMQSDGWYACFVLDMGIFEERFPGSSNSNKREEVLTHLDKIDKCLPWKRMGMISVLYNFMEVVGDVKGFLNLQATNIVNNIKDVDIQGNIQIGISMPFNNIFALEENFSNAVSAVKLGPKLWADRSTFYYGDTSVYQLVQDGSDKTHLQAYVKRHLGPLLQYDNKKQLEYLKTLELILESSNLQEAAKKSYVHYKTVQMRKKRIEKLLGISLDDMNVRMRLDMAVQLMKICEID